MRQSLLPRDVRDDDTVRPEEDVGRLAVVGEVLDVDRLLVQHEDVPGDLSLVRVRSRDTVAASDWCSPGARCWRRCRGREARSPAPGSSPRTPPTPSTHRCWTPIAQHMSCII